MTMANILVALWLVGIGIWLYRRRKRKISRRKTETVERPEAVTAGVNEPSPPPPPVPIHLVAQPASLTASPPWIRNVWHWTRWGYWLAVRLIDLAVGVILFGLLFWLIGAALSHHVLGHGLTRSAVGHWIVGIAQWESRFVQRL